MPAIGRQPHLSKTTPIILFIELSGSWISVSGLLLCEVFFFFFLPVLILKDTRTNVSLGSWSTLAVRYIFSSFSVFVSGLAIWYGSYPLQGLRTDTEKRNRRNVKSHPNKNFHVSKKECKSLMHPKPGIIWFLITNTVIRAEIFFFTHSSLSKPRDLLYFM